MKWYTSVFLFAAAVVIVECGHTFMGTNVMRPLVYHQNVSYSSRMFTKRIEHFNYTMPYGNYRGSIQGILAYDLTHSGASVNVTHGGIGYNFVSLRMKSDRAEKLNYEIYIYG